MYNKIGILTYHDSDNFGSVLQAYALSRYLLQQGYSTEIIDYRKPEVKSLYQIFKPPTNRYYALTNIYNLAFYLSLKHRKENFEKFRQEMLPLSSKCYTDQNQLKECNYSHFIVGSDQVWNVDILDFDLSYMLSFTDAVKISYAASFGPKEKPVSTLLPFQKYLSFFHGVSVREPLAVKLCENIFHIAANWVCDPVFLLEPSQWLQAIKPYPKRPPHYVLCYFPGGTPKHADILSKKLAKKLGYQRILLMSEWKNIFRASIKAYDCGPAEFLDLLIHADYICTTSFHGAAFSTLFGKTFYILRNGTDARIESLLSMTEPEVSFDIHPDFMEISPPSNYNKLSKHIQASKDFLKNALSVET